MERTREERDARLNTEYQHVFDLKGLISGLRSEEQAEGAARRNGVTLVKNGDLRVVLEVLDGGAALAEHQAPGPITVHVLDGELRFEVEREVAYLKPGEMVALPAGALHSVEAVRDSAFLLTLAMPPRSEG